MMWLIFNYFLPLLTKMPGCYEDTGKKKKIKQMACDYLDI